MPIRDGASLAKNRSTCPRRKRFCRTTAPAPIGIHLKHRFADIQADRDNLHRGRSPLLVLTLPPVWHIDAVRGPSTQHCERSEASMFRKALLTLDCHTRFAGSQ